jgi:hypothetical protein
MSHAPLRAYHVFMAAKVAINQVTEGMRSRNAAFMLLTGRLGKFMARRACMALNMVDNDRGDKLGRIMNLAVAATMADPAAMMTVDSADFELIRDKFFDSALVSEVQAQLKFATMPGGNA